MTSERLSLADFPDERLPNLGIGETVRVPHAGCRSGPTSAGITRTPAGWLMHCFKCGAKGLHVARVATAPKEYVHKNAALLHSDDVKHMLEPIRHDPSKYSELNRCWGIQPHDLSDHRLYLEEKAGRRSITGTPRLWFPLHSIGVSRKKGLYPGDIRFAEGGYAGKLSSDAASKVGTAYTKWYVVPPPPVKISEWYADGDYDLLYLPYNPKHKPSTPLVLVEDPISALRISNITNQVTAISLLGLSLGRSMLTWMGTYNGPIIVWPDGDSAGKLRGHGIHNQLSFIRGDKYTGIYYVNDHDPKDLTPIELGETIDRLCEAISDGKSNMETLSSAHP